MQRIQEAKIIEDLDRKMVFLAGPRQSGKTTLAQTVGGEWKKSQYLNYDADTDRNTIFRQQWDRSSDLVVLDEYHKLPLWKRRIKGIYDTEGVRPRILVTGSARLDIHRRGGDSLAGRYHLHRLYPLSVRELRGHGKPQEVLDQLMQLGGFPEPFLKQSEEAAARWRRQHLERIIREDVQDLEPVRTIQTLLLLVDLLRERVGSTISYASLARDLAVSTHTVKRCVETLENLYVLFVVAPFHRNIARAIHKEPKVYFYDNGAVRGGEDARLENAVAVSLRKWLHFLEDTKGKDFGLHYLRDREKREVDFVILEERKLSKLIEVKLGDDSLSPNLAYYHKRLNPPQSIQLVNKLKKSRTKDGIRIVSAAEWLAETDI